MLIIANNSKNIIININRIIFILRYKVFDNKYNKLYNFLQLQ